ncbi:MAG TPA: sialidase family protein [Thermoguttaceae bacterium]|nr:sialidase family protein [Thermoguttaceae bacterium]
MSRSISRRNLLTGALTAATVTALPGGSAGAYGDAEARRGPNGVNGCCLLPGAEFYVAIDNKGLWPNLTRLPGGELAAAVYNHPSHGYGSNSDVELWVSGDAGRTWALRSLISDHSDNPNAIRMNHAVGLNADGELVAIVSGYQEGQKLPMLPLQCCLSGDQGVTWKRHVLDVDRVPHGDVFLLPDGRLVCPMYTRTSEKPRRYRSSILFSDDGGRSWGDESCIAEGSEAHVIRCTSGVLLAAVRTPCLDRMDGVLPHGSGEMLFRSEDDGKTWSPGKPLSPQGQENAHLVELADGRILCSFTSRIPGLFGVVLRMSGDGGETWSCPVVLISMPGRDWHKTDCGYPSSVQLDDGTIVTAYYFGPKRPEWAAHGLPWHQRYHMGVARWDLSCWPEEDLPTRS